VLPDNAPLREALAAAVGDPAPEAQRGVLEAILAGTLIVALAPSGGEPPPPGSRGAPLAVAPGPDGRLTALVFSGPTALHGWAGTDRTASGPGRAMAALVRDQGVTAAVLDVAGPVAATLEHADLRALASGVAEAGSPVPAGPGRQAPLRLRAPDPSLPAEAADALRAALEPHAAVAAAYMFEGPPDGARRRLWLGLDLAQGAIPGAALADGVRALEPHVGGARVETTVVQRDGVLAALREAAPPLFERRR
jgi:type III secretion system (T3SS) SseB-like protein